MKDKGRSRKRFRNRKKTKKPKKPILTSSYRCSPGMIYNPTTKKCIRSDSKIGKQIKKETKHTIIGGPISFHYYKLELNGITRHIVLFGDEHTRYTLHNENRIIHISTLLKKIIKQSPFCIDLYSENIVYQRDKRLEKRGGGKSLQRHKSPLHSIRREFGSCPYHNYSNIQCNYDNLRYHNWDLRFILKSDNILGKWISNPYDELLMIPTVVDEFSEKFSHESIIKYILGFSLSKKVISNFDTWLDTKLDEHLNKPSFQKLVGDRDIMEHRKNIIQRQYKKLSNTTKFPKNLLNTFIQSYKSLNEYDFTAVFTDFYMICRIFMKFDTSRPKIKRSPRRCNIIGNPNFATPRYCIIYAGDTHIMNIASFIEKMFDVTPIYTTWKKSNNTVKKIQKVSKKINVNHIQVKQGFPKPETVDDLFSDFYG